MARLIITALLLVTPTGPPGPAAPGGTQPPIRVDRVQHEYDVVMAVCNARHLWWSPTRVQCVIRRVFRRTGRTREALNVAACESGFDPRSYNPSSASGVFQFLSSTWAGVVASYFHGAYRSVWDPIFNAMGARAVVARDGGWSEWVCRP